MCGRYFRRGQKQQIAERFRASILGPGMPDMLTSFNIAPTTFQPVIRHTRNGGQREMLQMRWGMVPFFAKSLADFKGFSTFNGQGRIAGEVSHVERTIREGKALLGTGRRLLRMEGARPGCEEA